MLLKHFPKQTLNVKTVQIIEKQPNDLNLHPPDYEEMKKFEIITV